MAIKKLSWQVTVTTAGTAVRGPSAGPGEYIIKSNPSNTGNVYVGNDGADDVSSTTGFTLQPGEAIIIEIEDLDMLFFDAAVNGHKFDISLIHGN